MADSDYDNIYGGADDEVDYGMASPVTTPKTELDNNAAAGPSQSSFQEQQRQIPSQSYNQVKSAPSDVQMARSLGGDSGNAQSALLVHEMHWVRLVVSNRTFEVLTRPRWNSGHEMKTLKSSVKERAFTLNFEM